MSKSTELSSYCTGSNRVTTGAVRGVAAAKAGISIAEFAESLGRLVGEKAACDEREMQKRKPELNLKGLR